MTDLPPTAAAANNVSSDDDDDDGETDIAVVVDDQDNVPSLCIPITSFGTSTGGDDHQFIEIFPSEMKDTAASTLLQVLKDEQSKLDVWAHASLLYMQQKQARESLTLLEEACESMVLATTSAGAGADKTQKVQILASTGIAHLAVAASTKTNRKNKSSPDDDLLALADQKFTQAAKVDTFFPMTWVGRGMLNLANNRLDQAKFFFTTTLKQCGPVLPAVLGMAAVLYGQQQYTEAQQQYAQAMKIASTTAAAAASASIRVGFGFCCYQLGQVDRAKAAFARALALDADCVDAMVGSALLDMASLDDESDKRRTERAIKLMSMANLLDHSNSMVQNHLANHYFWKWTPVTGGTVQVQQGSTKLTMSSTMSSLEPGERIRIGTKFETTIVSEDDNEVLVMQDAWKEPSALGLSVWKKDYDRVISLAKGAYGSTGVAAIQAESLFMLARVYHVRQELETAYKFYERSVKLAPALLPARFGLAQTLVCQGEYAKAIAHLQQLIQQSNNSSTTAGSPLRSSSPTPPPPPKNKYSTSTTTSAAAAAAAAAAAHNNQGMTDALALLGMLQVKTGDSETGLAHLRKATELDPLNPQLLILEAQALQQSKTTYARALQRYQKAMQLLSNSKKTEIVWSKEVPYEVYANSGVLSHETKQYPQAMDCYKFALESLVSQYDAGQATDEPSLATATLDSRGDTTTIRHDENDMFCSWLETGITIQASKQSPEKKTEKPAESSDKEKDADGDAKMADADRNHGEKDKEGEDSKDEDKEGGDAEKAGDQDVEMEKADKATTENPQGGEAETSKEKQTNEKKNEEEEDLSILKIVTIVNDPDDPAIAGALESLGEGDLIRLGDKFTSEITKIERVEPHWKIHLKDAFEEENTKTFPLLLKRENGILSKLPKAMTVAFNIARLHEATGRVVPAIELHKALLKRNPLYVNSSLRLACIAVDCGCLKECSEWLKIAAATSPGNPEVLTLIGNLHLSLCDWAAAQPVFDGLLAKKVPNVEAYAALSLGNIYFANLSVPGRYAKHLQYAADFYKQILTKDSANAYAANGLGTVLAERGEIFKAKEVFNRVREVSGDGIADALLNLGHIYLAQKKHPEALQMYQSYRKRAEDVSTPVSSKSRVDDVTDVLLYIAFTNFDWAQHLELFNDAQAAPADAHYKQAMESLKEAIDKLTQAQHMTQQSNQKKLTLLKYNLCMTKLQAANCVLQKLTRNIPRTVEEVEEALEGLQTSLVVVQEIVQEKNTNKKISIPSSTLQNFLTHCRAHISSAESHLQDERKRRADAQAEREIRQLAAEAAQQEATLQNELKKAKQQELQQERDRKAAQKMQKLQNLRDGWQQQQDAQAAEKARKARKMGRGGVAPGAEDFLVPDEEVAREEEEEEQQQKKGPGLFDDSSDDNDSDDEEKKKKPPAPSQNDLFGDSSDDDDDDDSDKKKKDDKKSEEATKKPSQQELFGDSGDDSDSDEDLLANKKKDEKSDEKKLQVAKEGPSQAELFGESEDSDEELLDKKKGDDDEPPQKKRRVLEQQDDDD